MTPGIGLVTVGLSADSAGPSASAIVNPDGTFEIRAARSGPHELSVYTGGMILYRETVFVNSPNQSITVRLPDTAKTARSSENTISLQQLAHKVPDRARRAFEKGEQAENKGNHVQAEDWLQQAVAIDPEFADAFNELGAVEANQGDNPRAIENFQKAIALAPQHRMALANLCIVLAKAKRFDEAAEIARRALQVAPGSGSVRFVLATSLYFVKGDTDEVLDNLERSASEVPRAHLVAAELLARRGKRAEAVQHVEDYLRVSPPDDNRREWAEAMLAKWRPQ
jgi:tetratricopeptide (TPR) repeat protein